MLILYILAAVAADPFAEARKDIDVFCKGNVACIKRQRSEMGYFVTMMTGFDDPDLKSAKRCMTQGKKGRHIDWTISTPCMRRAVKGRALGN